MNTHSIRCFVFLVCFIAIFFAVGCASQQPSLYGSWGQQLHTTRTIDDVSFLLGAPPTRCETIEPTPLAGIVFGMDTPTIIALYPNGAAAVAGMTSGERIVSINGARFNSSEDILATLRASLRWDRQITIATNNRSYSLTPRRPTEAKQCYWDIVAGSVAETRGTAVVNRYGGSAGQSGSAYQRFFRASCRFYDGYSVGCKSNWQE